MPLVDDAAHAYGPALTIETGMRQPFEQRVHTAMRVARAAVAVFEQRYS